MNCSSRIRSTGSNAHTINDRDLVTTSITFPCQSPAGLSIHTHFLTTPLPSQRTFQRIRPIKLVSPRLPNLGLRKTKIRLDYFVAHVQDPGRSFVLFVPIVSDNIANKAEAERHVWSGPAVARLHWTVSLGHRLMTLLSSSPGDCWVHV